MNLSRKLILAVPALLGLAIFTNAQTKSFTVGFDPPEERIDRNKVNVYIKVSNTAITTLTIFRTNPQKMAAFIVPKEGSRIVDTVVELKEGKAAELYIAGFDDNKKVIDERQISIGAPSAALASNNEVWQSALPSSNSKEKLVYILPPKGPVSDSRYILELRPRFNKNNIQPSKYVVVQHHATRSFDKHESAVKWQENDTDSPVNPVSIALDLLPGINRIEVNLIADGIKPEDSENYRNIVEINCISPCQTLGRNINTRAILGFEQTGASSAAGAVKPFVNFFLNFPIGNTRPDETSPRTSIWTDFRLTSTAAQRFVDVKKITGDFASLGSSLSTNEVVQSFRVNAGIERRIIGGDKLVPFFFPGKSSVSIIAGGGITAPLAYQRETASEIFKIPTVEENGVIVPSQEFRKFYSDLRDSLDGKVRLPELSDNARNIAFLQPERVRFYKRAFVGGRLKMDFWENDLRRMDVSPAIFDVTFGADESIADRMKFNVLSFEGFVPFPIGPKNLVYFYGGGSLLLTRNGVAPIPPLYMDRGSPDDLTSTTTITIPGARNPFTRSSRDGYFFGVGIDFIKLFSSGSEPKP